ncbi:hypothetical protein CPB83DRAFT_864319 [Crepidotus variabilis]|uniref:F-box domain-containing protein n=1 Tax=Crepidotus variabilis TaxID=179855 RepID=A0A9P6E4T4_9AGAR|nr:hypothetical protein CPB83DRAFT_864319 [Crepidotus variabilis]
MVVNFISCQSRRRRPPRRCTALTGKPCLGCLALTKLDAEIQEINESMNNLWLRRHETLTIVNEWHDPVVGTLPVELSSYIFQLYLPEISTHDMGLTDQTRLAFQQRLKILTSMCKAWRRIAISTPSLWSTVIGDKPETIDRHLQRSGTLSLSIYIQLYRYYQTDESRQNIIKSICQHIPRWRVLCIKGLTSAISFITKQTSSFAEGALSLSTIFLQAVDEYGHGGKWTMRIGGPHALRPSPTCLTIQASHFLWNDIDTTKLVELSIGPVRTLSFIDILRRSPRLKTVVASIEDANLSVSELANLPLEPFSHLELYSLEVTNRTTQTSSLFNFVTFPSLQNLGCTTRPSNQEQELTALHDFLLRSGCALQSLHLCHRCTEEDLLNLLQLTPNLQDLSIDETTLSSHFFRCLGGTAQDGRFLPSLRSLHFDVTRLDANAFDWSLICMMAPVPSLLAGTHLRPLSQIIVQLQSKEYAAMTEQDEMHMLALLESGVEIQARRWKVDQFQQHYLFRPALDRYWQSSCPPRKMPKGKLLSREEWNMSQNL